MEPCSISSPNVYLLQNPETALTLKEAWMSLEKKTQQLKSELNPLSMQEVQHRFNNIVCPLETAIKVETLDKKIEYIHANFVEMHSRKYAAAQAPLKNGLRNFWKVLFDTFDLIVDLTNLNDKLEVYSPVIDYAPQEIDQSILYGDVKVTLKEKNLSSESLEIFLYTYEVSFDQTSKLIKRWHFSKWPDFGVVNVQTLVELVETFNHYFKDLSVMVHCRAGVGRTGTFLTALHLHEKIRKDEVNKENLLIQLVEVILGLRKQRGDNFVQDIKQFILLVDYCHLLLKSK